MCDHEFLMIFFIHESKETRENGAEKAKLYVLEEVNLSWKIHESTHTGIKILDVSKISPR